MDDALDLFEEICLLEETQSKFVILMLNKVDLFRDKILKKNLDCYFADYKGNNNAAFVFSFHT